MKKRNILMCLQQLDIGGVETAVITMCKGYLRSGCKVYVAAENGVYKHQLESLGIEVLEIEYKIENHIFLGDKERLIKFCKDKEITEVHIHQYPCIAYWLPVCLELELPYIAYVHSIVRGAPEWFMSEFEAYRLLIPIFFENASKILCISESSKEEIDELFHLDKEKYQIIKNSLNMEDFPSKKASSELKKFGIAARLSEEKLISIKKGIDLFKEYSKKHADCELLIAGDGPEKEKIEAYIGNSKNIKLLGSLSNMPEFLNSLDVFMGVDRCILESIATKCLTIITSYSGSINILTYKNIEKASEMNFSGMNLDDDEKILETLEAINKKSYKSITESNYEYIDKYYNIDNNLYQEKVTFTKTIDYNNIFKVFKDCTDEITDLKDKIADMDARRLLNRIKRLIRKVLSPLRPLKKLLIKFRRKTDEF